MDLQSASQSLSHNELCVALSILARWVVALQAANEQMDTRKA